MTLLQHGRLTRAGRAAIALIIAECSSADTDPRAAACLGSAL